MEPAVVPKILDFYGVSYKSVLPMQKGYRNRSFPIDTGDRTLNLIIYKSEPGILERIKCANQVGDFLAKLDIPARKTYDSRIVSLGNNRFAALYEYLPGSTIPWESYKMEHLKSLGSELAQLHTALKTYPTAGLSMVIDENQILEARMKAYFSRPGVQSAMSQKLGIRLQHFNFDKIFSSAESLSAGQALHMDFVRGNILFEDQRIVGIIDFEKVSVGNPLFDIARTLAFLLVDCKYKSESQIRKYFLVSGYQKRGHGKINNYRLLDALVSFYLLHDFYKFLLHNPYESLHANEHYVRTVERLVGIGLLVKI